MKKTFFKSFFISFLAFVVMYGGISYYITNKKENAVGNNEDFYEENSDDDNDELIFLALGIDAKELTENNKERSDTMMLFKVDKSTGNISILSIPRDTRVMIRGRSGEEKVNHAHAYGGPELSVETVRDLLGIDLEYYVRVDYKIVEEFVNLIDGVEVDVPMNMKYTDLKADPPLYIDLKEGRQVLNGNEALQFLRFRKGYKDQDLGRIKAQQQFMVAAMDKTLKPANIVKIPQMIKAYYKYVDTNIPLDTLTKFAMKAKKFDTENMHVVTLPGEPETIDGISYFIPDEDESAQLVKKLFIEHEAVENEDMEYDNELN